MAPALQFGAAFFANLTVPTVGAQSVLDWPPLIDSHRKILFHHIHKNAGVTVSNILMSLPGVVPCNRSTSHAPRRELAEWWYDNASCNYREYEVMPFDSDFAALLRSKRPTSDTPQLITYYRDPVDRCRSHWRYLAGRCLHRCRYGNLTKMGNQRAFVRDLCTNFMSRQHALVPAMGLKFAHVGLVDRFAASVCLLLFQMAMFPIDMCTCRGPHRDELLRRLQDHTDRHDDEARAFAFYQLPDLRISDDDIRRHNDDDLALYKHAETTFLTQVRIVEHTLNVSFLDC